NKDSSLRVWLNLFARNRAWTRRWRRLAAFSGVHAIDAQNNGRTAVQPAPAFRNDNGIAGILRVILYRSGNSDAAVVQIDVLPKMGHVLGSFVLHAGNVVGVDQELGSV